MAIGLFAILHFLRDADDPAGTVACLRDAVAPGSYLAWPAFAITAGDHFSASGSGQPAGSGRQSPGGPASGYQAAHGWGWLGGWLGGWL